MKTALELFRELWAEKCSGLFLVEVVNYPADTNTFPDQWFAILYTNETREDVSLGSNPWVEETGFFALGLFAKSGEGPDVLDGAIAVIRMGLHGAAKEGLLISNVDGPFQVNESDGEFWEQAMRANYVYQMRRQDDLTPTAMATL